MLNKGQISFDFLLSIIFFIGVISLLYIYVNDFEKNVYADVNNISDFSDYILVKDCVYSVKDSKVNLTISKDFNTDNENINIGDYNVPLYSNVVINP